MMKINGHFSNLRVFSKNITDWILQTKINWSQSWFYLENTITLMCTLFLKKFFRFWRMCSILCPNLQNSLLLRPSLLKSYRKIRDIRKLEIWMFVLKATDMFRNKVLNKLWFDCMPKEIVTSTFKKC